jgi:Protein of unknown function, DUF481
MRKPTAPLTLLAVGMVAFVGRRAGAPIVNVQPMLASDRPNGFSGAVEGSSEIRTGNTQLSLVSGNGRIGYRSGPNFAFLLVRAEYGTRAGQVFLSRDLEHLRYRRHLAGPLELELFAQHDRDRFRRLDLRQLFGLGHRLTLLDEDEVNIAIGLAGMLEFERLAEGPQPDAGKESLAYRLSSYVTLGICRRPSLCSRRSPTRRTCASSRTPSFA